MNGFSAEKPDRHSELVGKTVLVMAGGTGGHVFPALTVAEKLRQLGMRIEWLGTRTGIEAQLVAREKIPINYIRVSGLRGKGRASLLLAPFKLLYALVQAIRVLWRAKPVCVLGMGGFASGPGGLAAWLMRKPLVIHEQNAIAGMTNRLLFRFAQVVLEAFPGAFETAGSGNHHFYRDSNKVHCVGNPVRGNIAALLEQGFAEDSKPAPEEVRLLVLGGSLGAAALNETLPKALALLSEGQRPVVRHQAGQRNYEAARVAYAEAGVKAQVDAFIDDMEQAYRWADVIVCRAGALTVAEIACAGLPALLVPYPHAVDDHQTANAQYLVAAGAALLLPQQEFTPEKVANLLTQEFGQRERIKEMSSRARSVAQTDAADRVAQHCLEVCYG